MCPPRGFYVCARHSREDALLILSVCFCGPRWIRDPTFDGHNLKFEITAIMLQRNQNHSSEKCRKWEEERSFVVQRVAADICLESMIRLIVYDFHQLQINCVRITESWPNISLKGRSLIQQRSQWCSKHNKPVKPPSISTKITNASAIPMVGRDSSPRSTGAPSQGSPHAAGTSTAHGTLSRRAKWFTGQG